MKDKNEVQLQQQNNQPVQLDDYRNLKACKMPHLLIQTHFTI